VRFASTLLLQGNVRQSERNGRPAWAGAAQEAAGGFNPLEDGKLTWPLGPGICGHSRI
jgi:hypothetical protein